MTFRTRSFAGLLAASLLALPAVAQQTAPAGKTATATLPDAKTILEKADQAMGAEAIGKFKNRMIKQQMVMAAQGLTLDIVMYTQGGNQILTETSMAGMTMKQGFDGKVGWANDPMQGPRVLSEAETEQMRLSPEAGGSMAQAFPTVKTLGEEAFEGRPCWKVSMKSPTGIETVGFFDQETSLLQGLSGSQPSPMGPVPYVAVMSGYADHHGMKIPAKTVLQAMGTEQVVTLQDVQVNLETMPSFSPPPEVLALMKDKN